MSDSLIELLLMFSDNKPMLYFLLFGLSVKIIEGIEK